MEPEVAMFPCGMQLHFPNTEGFFMPEPNSSCLCCSQGAWNNAQLVSRELSYSMCFNSVDTNLIKKFLGLPLIFLLLKEFITHSMVFN